MRSNRLISDTNDIHGEIVKRKNIGQENMTESQPEDANSKIQRLSETIFFLMLEIKNLKKKNKELEVKNLTQTELGDFSLIGLDAREKISHYKSVNEELRTENYDLKFKLDKFKNIEIEYQYYKENFTRIEELYQIEQQKRTAMEKRMESFDPQGLSQIEQTFEQKFKNLDPNIKDTELFQSPPKNSPFNKVQASPKQSPNEENINYGDSYLQGDTSQQFDAPGGLNDMSLLSNNLQKKINNKPLTNQNQNNMQNVIYDLSKEVDRLNIENQNYIEENLMLVKKLQEIGHDAPDFISDKFASNPRGQDFDDKGDVSELINEPGVIDVPSDKNKFNQLLSNDNTYFLKEQIQKQQNEIEVYVETIKEMEDKIEVVQKKNIRLENQLKIVDKDNFRESQKHEQENAYLKEKINSMTKELENRSASNSQANGSQDNSFQNQEFLQKIEKEREYYKKVIMEKQRTIIKYEQYLKDNNIDENGNRQVEENFNNNFTPKENNVNAQFMKKKMSETSPIGDSGTKISFSKKNPDERNQFESENDIIVSPSFKEMSPELKESLVRNMQNEIKKMKSNFEVERADMVNTINQNEEDMKLLLKRNSDLEDNLEKMRKKQKELRDRLKEQVNVMPKDEEAHLVLQEDLKSSVLQMNIEKMRNISASLLNEKQEEYQKEMRKLKLTMNNIDKNHLSSKNRVTPFKLLGSA
jgi:FtsZ-binding cell division protein ZapB